MDILEMFRERAEIAKEIGRFKEEKSLPVRIRNREKEILKTIPESDSLSRAIISSLFEFTIVNEVLKPDSAGISRSQTVELSGNTENLQLLAGLIISSPGVEVYSETPLPDMLSLGIQSNGGHIIPDGIEKPDLILGIDHTGDCGIIIRAPGTMVIDTKCLVSPKAKRILVKRN